ncbi:putative 10TM putative phosphate transporter, cytosolic domain-containing protein [Helianthus annuus]|nr:putative 10TM putative phosphate transporter, cytosolic domain-containing protein [Helianthus annuus]
MRAAHRICKTISPHLQLNSVLVTFYIRWCTTQTSLHKWGNRKRICMHNRLVYYTNEHERNPSKRPTTKVFGVFGGKNIDTIDYNSQEIKKLSKEVSVHLQRFTI